MNVYYGLLFLMISAYSAEGNNKGHKNENNACSVDEVCKKETTANRTNIKCRILVALVKDCIIPSWHSLPGIYKKIKGCSAKKFGMIGRTYTGQLIVPEHRVIYQIDKLAEQWQLDVDSRCNVDIERVVSSLLCKGNHTMCPNTSTSKAPTATTTVMERTEGRKVATKKASSDITETAASVGVKASKTSGVSSTRTTTPSTITVSRASLVEPTEGITAEVAQSSKKTSTVKSIQTTTSVEAAGNWSTTLATRTAAPSEQTIESTTALLSNGTSEEAAVVAGGLSVLWIIGIVVIVIFVIVIGAGVLIFFLKKKKNDRRPKDKKGEGKMAIAEVSMATRNRNKRKLPKVAIYKKMEAAPIKPEEFKFTGPLKLTSGAKGSMRHAMDGKSDHSIKDPVEFDVRLNEIVQIGTDVELLEPSASVSHGTDKTVADQTAAEKTVTIKTESWDKKPKK